MSNSISRTAIDEHVWLITRYLWERYGVDAGNRMISPLNWYISTGRASVDFLHKFVAAKPCVIGRILAKGGADDDILRAIRGRIKAA